MKKLNPVSDEEMKEILSNTPRDGMFSYGCGCGCGCVTGKTTEGRDINNKPVPYVTVGGSKVIPEQRGNSGITADIACKSIAPENRDMNVHVSVSYNMINCIGDEYS